MSPPSALRFHTSNQTQEHSPKRFATMLARSVKQVLRPTAAAVAARAQVSSHGDTCVPSVWVY